MWRGGWGVGGWNFEQNELIYKKLIKVLTSVKPTIIEKKKILFIKLQNILFILFC